MPRSAAKTPASKSVEALRHDEAKRKNIPTAEYQAVLQRETQDPVRVAYERRNRDLDPQLVWRGKDEQDWSDLVVHAPPLYIQEKVHPKALIDDLLRQTREAKHDAGELHADLFSDFNGIPKGADRTEFYTHDQNWSNRMILGDSLQVMASLAEREGLRGKVQCIYIDPPYGIRFNSNFQWSTTSRDVKDGNAAHITREPEQVKAFRDTWRDGIHSYLTYLRDRLTVARDLLADSGSIFVQIGDENVHLVRALLDEVFGSENFKSEIAVTKSTGLSTAHGVINRTDYVLWYCRNHTAAKLRSLYVKHEDPAAAGYAMRDASGRIYMSDNLTKPGPGQRYPVHFQGRTFTPGKRWWGLPPTSMTRVAKSGRLLAGVAALRFVRYFDDYPFKSLTNLWDGLPGAPDPTYVVQTHPRIIERCVLLSSDPGDIVLDPTCGSGTSAYVAEQWGRRWITIDTSRVALALARARIMGARYPFHVLADSREGQLREAELTHTTPSSQPARGDVRQGFVYERVPHVTLKSIANNAEIDVIWERWQETLEPLLAELNAMLKKSWEEWEIPRDAESRWPEEAKQSHARWWEARIARQKEIDASIAAKAEFEYLYDRPYEDRRKVRVAGPFTVESLSPHRVLGVDEHDELIDQVSEPEAGYGAKWSFPQMIVENLRVAGVQQAHKEDRITFTALEPWPGEYVAAAGRYVEAEGGAERRAAILIGPEFGTVTRPDLVAAAREAADAGFDVLIACAFSYEAHATEFDKLGKMRVLKARMNADLHMAEDLKSTGKGNLFVIFGEPDIEILPADGGKVRVKIKGVDVFDPANGEVRSDDPSGIACWFIDTDYNEESFFVRHAYFLGASDPYENLRLTLRSEIDEWAWMSLYGDTSRPFEPPRSGRIAVKVINYLGDEVMKVFRV
ncbi:MAG TPA: site-specific DNA-methyltransferase [Gemmatimonadaceae bacterium]|nr:site-specific DNA-methyltransferase [Gemmatimonadaceae bacterium]